MNEISMIFIIHRHETLLFYDLWFYIDFDETMIDIVDRGILLAHLHVNVHVVAFTSRQLAVKFPYDYLVLDLLMYGRSKMKFCEEPAKYDEKSMFPNMIFPAHECISVLRENCLLTDSLWWPNAIISFEKRFPYS